MKLHRQQAVLSSVCHFIDFQSLFLRTPVRNDCLFFLPGHVFKMLAAS